MNSVKLGNKQGRSAILNFKTQIYTCMCVRSVIWLIAFRKHYCNLQHLYISTGFVPMPYPPKKSITSLLTVPYPPMTSSFLPIFDKGYTESSKSRSLKNDARVKKFHFLCQTILCVYESNCIALNLCFL